MIVYRLAKQRFNTLDGEGARLYPGRWNTSRHKVLYTASTSSLAILEVIANIQKYKYLYNENFVLITLNVPDKDILDLRNDTSINRIGFSAFPFQDSQAKGAELFHEATRLGFIVPSIVNPHEANIILNAGAFDLKQFKTREQVMVFDPRFMK
jgi:RES domain-containing protein